MKLSRQIKHLIISNDSLQILADSIKIDTANIQADRLSLAIQGACDLIQCNY